METGKPRVGEIVELRDNSSLHGLKYLVVECPGCKLSQYGSRDDLWWVVPAANTRHQESAGYIRVGVLYVVLSDSGVVQTSAVPDDIDAKLNKLRDDNLRDQFKYW